ELKETLKTLALKIPVRRNETVARLPIDRSFSVKGFGAVATGTLVSGEIGEADELEILPLKKIVRVRGLQTHGKTVKTVRAGQRAAINLGGIEHSEIVRGMVLAEKAVLRPTQIFDAQIENLKDARKSLKTRQRVRVHIGTIEALARVQIINEKNEIAPGEKDFVQLRLETPIVCVPNERFIIRSYSPQITIAGGRVLDNSTQKHRRRDAETVKKQLEKLIEADDDKTKQMKLRLEAAAEHGLTFADLQARTGWRREVLKRAIAENVENRAIIEAESFFVARMPFENLKAKTFTAIENFHRREPLAKGMLQATLREKIFAHFPVEIFKAVISNLEQENKIATEKDAVKLAAHNLDLSGEEKLLRETLQKIYRTAKLEVPKLEDALTEAIGTTKSDKNHARKVFQLLLNSGELVKITDEFYFPKTEIERLTLEIQESAAKTSDRLIDVSAFKLIAGVSRKYAIPLLEYFDREKITRRAGDKRLIL
ncbi:MAG: SelB C-terminal domain-containing protein, partial [Acidobacteriota bacterium]|nr:SelB C-terminal domain-containing protein [Acidobacteriota bacterium]